MQKILLNFESYNLTSRFSNATVATYEMDYGKGKSDKPWNLGTYLGIQGILKLF